MQNEGIDSTRPPIGGRSVMVAMAEVIADSLLMLFLGC
jgi:hypothetical protein